MGSLADIGSWITANEALLSGLAAMIVVGGVVLSTLGVGARRIAAGRKPSPDRAPSEDEAATYAGEAGPSGGAAAVTPLTLAMLTAPSPHETKFADSAGVRIAYNERGTGPPDLIVAPGIISHLNIMENLPTTKATFGALERFAHVVTFDKRGQGLSDPTLSSPNLEERTADIEAVMDDAGIDRAVLMGVSEGGPMCLHFAYTHPERVQGLVLLGTTARWLQSAEYPIGLAQNVLEQMPRSWGRGVLRDLFFPSLSREQLDDATYRAFENLIGDRTSVQQIVEMMIATDVRPLLPEIRVPTLVIHFAGDLAVPIRLGRFVADHIPNAEFMEAAGADHADLAESADAVARVRQFCERIVAEDTATPAGR